MWEGERICMYIEVVADPSDVGRKTHVCYRGGFHGSFRGRTLFVYVEALADPRDVRREDACVRTRRRSRNSLI